MYLGGTNLQNAVNIAILKENSAWDRPASMGYKAWHEKIVDNETHKWSAWKWGNVSAVSSYELSHVHD